MNTSPRPKGPKPLPPKAQNVQQHRTNWQTCQRCPLHRHRHRVVLYRGSVPADILFIGEAPGPSEDILGKPFIGPAGNILNQILQDVFNNLLDVGATGIQTEFAMPTYCFTNVVCCFPEVTAADIEAGFEKPDAKLGIRDPRKVEAEACRPRLDEFIDLVQPRLIVRLGKTAVKHTAHLVGKYPVQNLIHPGALTYMDDNPAMQRLEFDKCVSRLTKWILELDI